MCGAIEKQLQWRSVTGGLSLPIFCKMLVREVKTHFPAWIIVSADSS